MRTLRYLLVSALAAGSLISCSQETGETFLHVPLVVKLPRSLMAGKTIGDVVQLIDVYPAVLDLAEIPADGPGDALSLVDLASGETEPGDRRVFSESMYPRLHYGWSELTSLTDGDVHVIQAPMPELYLISKDPDTFARLGRNDLAAQWRDRGPER